MVFKYFGADVKGEWIVCGDVKNPENFIYARIKETLKITFNGKVKFFECKT